MLPTQRGIVLLHFVFRTACEDGLVLGRKIGERAAAMYLQPVKK